jgi:hypothetical protein
LGSGTTTRSESSFACPSSRNAKAVPARMRISPGPRIRPRFLYCSRTSGTFLTRVRCARSCTRMDAERVRSLNWPSHPCASSSGAERTCARFGSHQIGLQSRSSPSELPTQFASRQPKNLPEPYTVPVWRAVSRCIPQRRRPDSNWGWRFCRPLPYHLATAPMSCSKGLPR